MPTSTTALLERINELGIDCTYRQMDYWCRLGYLGDDNAGKTPGWQRHFNVADLEALHALNELRKLTKNIDGHLAADVVRARPVAELGEILVVEADGNAYRVDHWCASTDGTGAPVCVIPLRSFATASTPADGSDLLPPGTPAAGPEDGRHRTATVPANHAITTT